MSRVAVIENLAPESAHSAAEIAQLFGCETWVQLKRTGTQVAVVGAAPTASVPAVHGTFEFYEALLKNDYKQVFRIHGLNYPLNRALAAELEEQFPADRFPYVLSAAEECGLNGYFTERLSPEAMARIGKLAEKTAPVGYFTGMALPNAGRHWFSLALRNFYLDENFETLFDSPRSVVVNAVANCNFSCAKCQYHSPLAQAKEHYTQGMSLEKFKVLLERVKDYRRLTAVYPSITGEPLMHPEIVAIVKAIKDSGYSVGFTTNGLLLTPETTDALLDAGLDGLAFSVDSVNAETYEKLQEGGNLATVEKNMRYYRDAVLRRKGAFSAVVNCVVSEENDTQHAAFRKRWAEEGFSVQFSTYHNFLDSNRPHFVNEPWGPSQRMPCAALWTGLYLTSEGRAVTCGAMAKTLGIQENIFDMTPHDLWRCEALNKLRKQQLTGVKPGYCKEFTCWTGQIGTYSLDEDGEQVYYTLGSTMYPRTQQAAAAAPAASRFRQAVSRVRNVFS